MQQLTLNNSKSDKGLEDSTFYSEETGEREFDLENVLNKGLHGVQFFKCLVIESKLIVFMNLQNFFLQFK